MVAPMLLETSPNHFKAGHHPQASQGCTSSHTDDRSIGVLASTEPSQLNTSMAEIGNHSQLESLYIGFTNGFCGFVAPAIMSHLESRP